MKSLRTVSHICFLYFVLCFFAFFGMHTALLAVTALICAVMILLSSALFSGKSGPLPALFTLLSALAVFFAVPLLFPEVRTSLALRLAVGGACVIMTVFGCFRKPGSSYYASTLIFRMQLLICLVMTGWLCVFCLMNRSEPWPGIPVFGIAFGVSGVIGLRSMRCEGKGRGWELTNIAEVLVPTLSVGVALCIIYLGLSALLAMIKPDSSTLPPRLRGEYAQYQSNHYVVTQVAVSGGNRESEEHVGDEHLEIIKQEEEENRLWPVIAAAVIVTAVAAFFIIRRRMKKKAIEKLLEDDLPQSPSGDAVISVRRIYREYLEFLTARGLNLRRGSTSADVLKLSSSGGADCDDPEAVLRGIYIRARYAGEVSAQDVLQARSCLDAVTGAEKTGREI